LCAESNVVGFDLVEFTPERDPTYVSGLNANRIVREYLVGIAIRKKGITEEHYLSPLTANDGRGNRVAEGSNILAASVGVCFGPDPRHPCAVPLSGESEA
jgi:hypothetical protein